MVIIDNNYILLLVSICLLVISLILYIVVYVQYKKYSKIRIKMYDFVKILKPIVCKEKYLTNEFVNNYLKCPNCDKPMRIVLKYKHDVISYIYRCWNGDFSCIIETDYKNRLIFPIYIWDKNHTIQQKIIGLNEESCFKGKYGY